MARIRQAFMHYSPVIGRLLLLDFVAGSRHPIPIRMTLENRPVQPALPDAIAPAQDPATAAPARRVDIAIVGAGAAGLFAISF